MTSPVSTTLIRNASPVSLTPVMSCITGVVITEIILYQTGRRRGDWGGMLEGLVVIVSWEGERGLGWHSGGVGSHCELGGEERTGLAFWRGWWSL